MNSLKVFEREGWAVRTIFENENVWFVAKDVAQALGYVDTAQAVRVHCKGALNQQPLETAGGTQQVRVIQEPDVYRLIISSKLPTAQKFEKWVMEEVLPSIRKTGNYSFKKENEQPFDLAKLLQQTRLAFNAGLLSREEARHVLNIEKLTTPVSRNIGVLSKQAYAVEMKIRAKAEAEKVMDKIQKRLDF